MPKKALVVDADYFFIEFLSDLLEKKGYAVTKAYDGKEGIAKLDNGPYDVVFADLVLPKVAGQQFIQFCRLKYGKTLSPIVALSGAMVEHLGALGEIEADYYIAKGPIDKLTPQLNEFMAQIETHPVCSPDKVKIIETGNVYPRRDAIELLNSLKFYQAVFENLGVGMVIVDRDVRILNVNPLAIEIIGKPPTEVINVPVVDIFPMPEKKKLAHTLKQIIQLPEKTRMSFCTLFEERIIRATVSAFFASDHNAGWVIALQDQENSGISH
jgi:PAS domain S-box-containing protein